jgi:hypothetical protein
MSDYKCFWQNHAGWVTSLLSLLGLCATQQDFRFTHTSNTLMPPVCSLTLFMAVFKKPPINI